MLSPQVAAELALSLLQCSMQVAQAFDADAELWVDGNIDDCKLHWPGPVHEQVPGDLGARMMYAANRTVTYGHAPIIIGSDCPFITLDYLQCAHQHLTDHDAVIGPALDGGYVLIGMRRLIPEIFEDIPWSTAEVLKTTRNRLAASGYRWTELQPPLADIDEPHDLMYFLDSPQARKLLSPELLHRCLQGFAGHDADRNARLR